MGLKRFDNKLPEKKKSIKQILIVLCICLIAVTSLTSYAIFKVQHNKPFVNSKVGNFKTAITIIIDGEESDVYPEKDSDKIFDKIECTSGNAEWDEEAWKLTNINVSGRTKCTVSFITKTEIAIDFGTDESGAEAPVLNNGMIPVIWNENAWVKADTSKAWYNYDNQIWANAVTVSEETRDKYTTATSGIEIKMDDIETMWVWVPRYEYQHTNLSTQYAGGTSATQPGGITINFISKETITPSSDNFTIHDAFWFSNDTAEEARKDLTAQLSGIWVAKFEMSTGNTTCTPIHLSVEIECDLATINPQIKPNVTSWSGARIGTFWTAIHNNMNGENNIYGLSNSDAHLMKNIEWGAVAYLSQSKYGKYGNPNYEGTDKEVAVNNCNNYITGIGGDTVSAAFSRESCTTNTYETEKGQAASTTGNIYGIYDMNGGAWEYVMGVMKESTNTELAVGNDPYFNSGWSGIVYDSGNWIYYEGKYGRLGDDKTTEDVVEGIGSKYYDLYDYGTVETVTEARAHKGDATFETKGWYSDDTSLIAEGDPIFIRGGISSRTSKTLGLFGSYGGTGCADEGLSARPIIVQTN